jgi:hypothetical protein
MKVFLSYPSEHLETVVEVKNFVRSVGVECWFDKDNLVLARIGIAPGTNVSSRLTCFWFSVLRKRLDVMASTSVK